MPRTAAASTRRARLAARLAVTLRAQLADQSAGPSAARSDAGAATVRLLLAGLVAVLVLPAIARALTPGSGGRSAGGELVTALAVLLALVLWVGGYLISLRVHPYTRCRRCGGDGKHHGRLYPRAFRACPGCRGTGRRPRLGVRLFVTRR